MTVPIKRACPSIPWKSVLYWENNLKSIREMISQSKGRTLNHKTLRGQHHFYQTLHFSLNSIMNLTISECSFKRITRLWSWIVFHWSTISMTCLKYGFRVEVKIFYCQSQMNPSYENPKLCKGPKSNVESPKALKYLQLSAKDVPPK